MVRIRGRTVAILRFCTCASWELNDKSLLIHFDPSKVRARTNSLQAEYCVHYSWQFWFMGILVCICNLVWAKYLHYSLSLQAEVCALSFCVAGRTKLPLTLFFKWKVMFESDTAPPKVGAEWEIKKKQFITLSWSRRLQKRRTCYIFYKIFPQ